MLIKNDIIPLSGTNLIDYLKSNLSLDYRPYWFYINNWTVFFSGSNPAFLSHFWSLAIEEQFYLVWPFVIRQWNTRTIVYIALSVIGFSPIIRYLLGVYGEYSPVSIYVSTFCRLDGFMIGALAYLIHKSNNGYDKWKRLVNALGTLSLIVLSAIIYFDQGLSFLQKNMSYYGFTFLNILIGMILLYSLSPNPNKVVYKLISNKVTRFFGKYSYSMYVFHPWIMISVLIAMTWMGYEQTIVNTISYTAITISAIVLFSLFIWHGFEAKILSFRSKILN